VNELPEGWKHERGENIYKLVRGVTYDKVHARSEPGEGLVPILRANNIQNGTIQIEDLVYVPEGYVSQNQYLQPGDLLIATSSGSRDVVGKTATAQPNHQKFAFGAFCSVARPKTPEIAPWIFYYTRSSAYREYVESVALGININNFRTRDLAALPLPLPPLAEQRRIVARLDALLGHVRRARAELARVPGLIERQKQAVLAQAFAGELTAAWRVSSEPQQVFSQLESVRKQRNVTNKPIKRKIAASFPDFEIPVTWEWISPDEIASDEPYSIGIGPFGSNLLKSDYRQEGVRLIFVRDIRRERFDDTDARYVSIEKATELYQHITTGGDVLITKMGEPPGDSTLYPFNAESAVITSDCIKLRSHPSLAIPQYLVFCIRSPIVKEQIEEITMGVAQRKVSLDRFRQIALPTPPLPEQHEIVARIETAFARIERSAAEAARAAALLDRMEQATLAQAFRGEL
jgi:type I restriction enzyme S subunit